jgi:peptidoglycan-associated lipoprotein
MKHTLPGFICASMIVLAGCSSKSAIQPGEPSATGAGSAGVESSAGPASGSSSEVASGAVSGPVVGAMLGDVFYQFDSSVLSEEAQEQLKQDVAWMKSNPAQTVIIEGHCDERGTDEYNIALGERRAISAKDYLVTLGISASRISTISYGEERPFDPGHNEEAWAKNRRAHFVPK